MTDSNTTYQVESGVASLSLDESTLGTAGLALTGVNSDTEPAAGFEVGFAVAEDSDFIFDFAQENFQPLEGTINHLGTITFNDQTTVGEFLIGYDPSRITDTTSGFFVADTLVNPTGAILFDISTLENLTVEDDSLTLAGADLLLAPEFAGVLGNPGLQGQDIGDVRVDAVIAAAQPEVM